MSRSKASAVKALAGILLVSSLSFSREYAPAQGTPQDEPAIRSVVSKYFALYANKDLEGLVALWDPASPVLAARKTEIQKLFAATSMTSLKSVSIRKLKMDGSNAIARVALEITSSNEKQPQTPPSVAQMNRILRFIRSDEGWKIQEDILAEEQLASEIAAAAGDEARRQLIEDQKDLADKALWESLSARARESFQRADYAKSLALLEINRHIAEQLSDKTLIARTLNNTGIIYQWRGDYPAALDHLKKSLDLAESIGLKPVAAPLCPTSQRSIRSRVTIRRHSTTATGPSP